MRPCETTEQVMHSQYVMDGVNEAILKGKNGKVTMREGTEPRPKLSRANIKPCSTTQGPWWHAVNSKVLGYSPQHSYYPSTRCTSLGPTSRELQLSVAEVSCSWHLQHPGISTVPWASASQLHASPSYLTATHSLVSKSFL